MNRLKQTVSVLLSCCLVFIMYGLQPAYAELQTNTTAASSAQPSPEQLQQLVAPIALYTDALVAQILAAATYPEQVVQADRWLQEHRELKGEHLAQAVDQQPWDPSVKALTEFPSVLANMDKNLSWTSSLGDAYINHQQDLMNAVQVMRQRAQTAGTLASNKQQTVSQQGQSIVITPANPQVIYVPQYDPWIVYGVPVIAWPDWYWYPGLYWTSPGVAFGFGFGIGFFAGYSWGYHCWAPNWHNHTIIYNRSVYVSNSRTFVNRNYYTNRAYTNRMNSYRNPAGAFSGHNRMDTNRINNYRNTAGTFSGYDRENTNRMNNYRNPSGVFSGYNHGGVTGSYSFRGFSSQGGYHGGGFHGGRR